MAVDMDGIYPERLERIFYKCVEDREHNGRTHIVVADKFYSHPIGGRFQDPSVVLAFKIPSDAPDLRAALLEAIDEATKDANRPDREYGGRCTFEYHLKGNEAYDLSEPDFEKARVVLPEPAASPQ